MKKKKIIITVVLIAVVGLAAWLIVSKEKQQAVTEAPATDEGTNIDLREIKDNTPATSDEAQTTITKGNNF